MNGVCDWCATPVSLVLDLGRQPLANALVEHPDVGSDEFRAPLVLAICPACGLVQITEAVPPERMFREYAYFSSVSDAFVAHAAAIAGRMRAGLGLGPDSLAIEIASNDGYLLQHYAAAGVPVLGVDPARNIAAVANSRGIPTLPEFFTADLAAGLASEGRTADVIHANNVIAHVASLDDVAEGIALALKPDGVAVIETPYVRDLVEKLEFDTIYHEHRYYHSVTTLGRILGGHGLRLAAVERIPMHGGSIRLFATHASSSVRVPGVPATSADDLLAEEARLGLAAPAYYLDFARRVESLVSELREQLADLKAAGRSVAAYGAAAKGTVLLNALGVGTETLDFVADRSPHKQGRYMPGVHVPIVPAEHLAAARPDVCLVLAWNFADEILAQQAEYRAAGGRLLIPIPTPKLV